ncbi:MAG: hypothetical protein AAFY56_18440, partial [Pseudomonadota bacterium]
MLEKGIASRATLLRLLSGDFATDDSDLAHLLNYRLRETRTREENNEWVPGGRIRAISTPQAKPRIETQELQAALFWQPLHYRALAALERQAKQPAAILPATWRQQPDPQPFKLLAEWPDIEPRLAAAFQYLREGRRIDIDAIVGNIARGKSLDRFPLKARSGWSDRLLIIDDRSEHLGPFWADRFMIVDRLVRLLPTHSLEIAVLRNGDRIPKLSKTGATLDQDGALAAGTDVLCLSDLGAYARDWLIRKRWLALSLLLKASRCRLVLLFPGPLKRVPRELRNYWTILPWERPRPVSGGADLSNRKETLFRLVAMASRVEPQLLRSLRLVLPEGEADAGTEADVWNDVRMQGKPSLLRAIAPAVRKQLQLEWEAQVAAAARDMKQRARYRTALTSRRRAIAAIRSHRPDPMPPEIWFMEMLNQDEQVRAEVPTSDIEDARNDALWFAQQTEKGEISGLSLSWWRRQRAMASNSLWSDPKIGHALKVADYRLLRDEPNYVPPPDLDLRLVRSADPDEPVRKVRLHQRGGCFKPKILTADGQPEDGSVVGDLSAQESDLISEALGETDARVFWIDGVAPSWAKDWGTDAYGAWMSFVVTGGDGAEVEQRMRWIPPGRFMMGSPEDEEGRESWEGPLHEVTFE